MIRVFLISIFFLALNLNAEPTSKPLQTSSLQQTNTGYQVLVKPLTGHHFNLEAPTKVKKNDKEISSIEITATSLTIPLSKEDLAKDKKCELQIQTYVCDDKKTFCSPQTTNIACANLQKHGSSLANDGTKSVAVLSPPSADSVAKIASQDLFILNDPKFAFEQAAKTGKPLFIDFFGTWCPPCNVLDETVFKSKTFQAHAKDFVLLKLDVDEKVSWDLKSKFGVKGYPTVVLATPNGDEITRFVGAIPEFQIVNLMNQTVKNKNTSLAQARDLYLAKPSSRQALEIIN